MANTSLYILYLDKTDPKNEIIKELFEKLNGTYISFPLSSNLFAILTPEGQNAKDIFYNIANDNEEWEKKFSDNEMPDIFITKVDKYYGMLDEKAWDWLDKNELFVGRVDGLDESLK